MKISDNAVLRYAVPFYFESAADITGKGNEYVTLCNKLKSDNTYWTPDNWEKGERDTFEYLYRSLFYEADDCHIGSGWRYSLPDNLKRFRYYPDPKDSENFYEFGLKEAGLCIFRTNVGLFWYEITFPKLPREKRLGKKPELLEVEFIEDFQNRFKELNYRHNKYFKLFSKENNEETVLVMGDFVHDLLMGISKDIHYLNGERKGSDGGERPDKALIFNYTLVKDSEYNEARLHKSAFALANGYNARYRMPKDSEKDFVEAFSETCWYASRGGCGYFAYVNENEENSFFESVLPQRIRGDYFFMYILALYQSYSILNYLRRIMQYYPADPKKYFELEQGGELDSFTAEINTFLMKGMYSSVSNVHHQNRFFQYLQTRLNIKEDIDSITMGVEAMAKVQRLHNEKEEARLKAEEEKREAKHAGQMNLILTVISVLSVFSALVDMHEFMNRIDAVCAEDGYFKGMWKLLSQGDVLTYFQLVVGLAVVGLSVACVAVLIKSNIANRKKDRKK